MDLLGIFEGRKLGAIALSGKDMTKKWVLKDKFEGEGRGSERAGGRRLVKHETQKVECRIPWSSQGERVVGCVEDPQE